MRSTAKTMGLKPKRQARAPLETFHNIFLTIMTRNIQPMTIANLSSGKSHLDLEVLHLNKESYWKTSWGIFFVFPLSKWASIKSTVPKSVSTLCKHLPKGKKYKLAIIKLFAPGLTIPAVCHNVLLRYNYLRLVKWFILKLLLIFGEFQEIFLT